MKKEEMDKLNNKEFNSVANNIYRKEALMRIILDPELDVEYRNSVIATIGAEMASLVAALIGIAHSINIALTILGIVIVFQTPIIFAIIGKILKEKDGRISKHVSTVVFILELPVIYCLSGGSKGPGLIWFLFAFLVITTIFPRKQAINMTVVCVIIEVATFVITEIYPELIADIDADKARINSILCMGSIAIAMAIITFLQKSLNKVNEEYLKKIQSDLEENNKELINAKEELIASNEEITAMNEDLIETTMKLNLALDENGKALAQQRRFTAMLNHELRNPLNGIMGYLQLQLMNEHIPEPNKKAIRDSYTLTESMLQTVNDILDFSKMQEGKFEIVKADFSLNDVIHNIHTIFDENAKKKGLELVYNIPWEAYNLYSDGIRIQQIIVNLMSNSVKYTKEGKVSLAASVKDSRLNVTISDTGKGMTKEEVDFIFEPYKRFDLHGNKNIQGTGLGMSIVKKLMDQLEGTIEIESEVNKGTTFMISIPVEVRKVEKEATNNNVEETVDLTDKLFLTVDDDAINLTILGLFLEKNNATVITAKNGKEAVSIIESGKCNIDMVITDNNMPEMTGIELKKYMNGHDMKIPSIILSGDTDSDSVARFKDIGFDEVLPKPVIYNELIRSIKKAGLYE